MLYFIFIKSFICWIYLFYKIMCIKFTKLYLQDVREEMPLRATITLSQSNRI